MADLYVSPASANVPSAGATSNTISGSGLSLLAGDFRLACCWLASTTITISSPPSGWLLAMDDITWGGMRQAIYYRFQAADGQPPDAVFGFSASVLSAVIENRWRGVDQANPFLVTPTSTTGSGQTTGTSLAAPDFTLPAAGQAVWFYASKPTTSASAANVALPVTSASSGGIQTTAASGFRVRAGREDLPSGAAGGRIATSSPSAPWRVTGLALRPASARPGQFLPFFAQHHEERPSGLWAPPTDREVLSPPRRRHGRIIDLATARRCSSRAAAPVAIGAGRW